MRDLAVRVMAFCALFLGAQSFAYDGVMTKVNKKKKTMTLKLKKNKKKDLNVGDFISIQGKKKKKEIGGTIKKIKRGKAVVAVKYGIKRASPKTRFRIKNSFIKKRRSTMLYKPGGSEANRMDKSVSFTFGGGTSVAPVPSGGLDLGIFLGSHGRLELSYQKGAGFIPRELGVLPKELPLLSKINTDLATLSLRSFVGNSFNLKAGFGIRRIDTLVWSPDPQLGASLAADEDLIIFQDSKGDAVFNFSIGNNWQFDIFQIGFDWVGITAPLSKAKLPDSQPTYVDPVIGEEFDFSKIATIGPTYRSSAYMGISF